MDLRLLVPIIGFAATVVTAWRYLRNTPNGKLWVVSVMALVCLFGIERVANWHAWTAIPLTFVALVALPLTLWFWKKRFG